jgi:hypothetical protein
MQFVQQAIRPAHPTVPLRRVLPARSLVLLGGLIMLLAAVLMAAV